MAKAKKKETVIQVETSNDTMYLVGGELRWYDDGGDPTDGSARYIYVSQEDVRMVLEGRQDFVDSYRSGDNPVKDESYGVGWVDGTEGQRERLENPDYVFSIGCQCFDRDNFELVSNWAGYRDKATDLWVKALERGWITPENLGKMTRIAPDNYAAAMRQAGKLRKKAA